MKFRIEPEGDYNLSDIYDLLRDGYFGITYEADDLEAHRRGSGLHSAGSGRITKITVRSKPGVTEQEVKELIEKIKLAAGSRAHIHIE